MKVSRKKPPNCPRCCPFPKSRCSRIRLIGQFYRSSRSEPIQRYKCLDCYRSFSDATLTREYRQRKRYINHRLYELLSSAVSMRRSAEILGIARKTVERRLPYFSLVAKDYHGKIMKEMNPVNEAQFDDMESWIHTKLKPVSIPLVVEHPSRLILSFDVVSMPAKGKLAKISRAKYGLRADHRPRGWDRTLAVFAQVAKENVKITSDSHAMYPAFIRQHLPSAFHKQVASRRGCVVGQGELKKGGYDPIFSFNHTAAMIRANVNRLGRRTWCTSKKAENLKRHMDLYILRHNETILARISGRKRNSPFLNLT